MNLCVTALYRNIVEENIAFWMPAYTDNIPAYSEAHSSVWTFLDNQHGAALFQGLRRRGEFNAFFVLLLKHRQAHGSFTLRFGLIEAFATAGAKNAALRIAMSAFDAKHRSPPPLKRPRRKAADNLSS